VQATPSSGPRESKHPESTHSLHLHKEVETAAHIWVHHPDMRSAMSSQGRFLQSMIDFCANKSQIQQRMFCLNYQSTQDHEEGIDSEVADCG
jgi:hypothetical protein